MLSTPMSMKALILQYIACMTNKIMLSSEICDYHHYIKFDGRSCLAKVMSECTYGGAITLPERGQRISYSNWYPPYGGSGGVR